MQPVILDTDVASLTHKRKLTGPVAGRLIGRRPLITFVTLGELTKWMEIRHWGAQSRQALADWLSGIPVLPGDEPVAAMWGRLSAVAIQRGRSRPVNDMWIAACCSTYDLPLATLNLKITKTFRTTTVCEYWAPSRPRGRCLCADPHLAFRQCRQRVGSRRPGSVPDEQCLRPVDGPGKAS